MATTISFPTAVTDPDSKNADNAFADDGTLTDFFLSAGSDITYTSFSGLSIPSGATINGIEVIGDATSNASTPPAMKVSNGAYSANKAANSAWGRSVSTIDPSHGAADALWGLSWDATTAAAIRLQLDLSTMTSGRIIKFDYIKIRVTFTAAASGYGHTVNGVAPANIGKVNAVATGDIGKINSVD